MHGDRLSDTQHNGNFCRVLRQSYLNNCAALPIDPWTRTHFLQGSRELEVKVVVEPKYLEKGMYVAELDRPWLETPFLFQGFRITNAQELEQLTSLCDFVFVDTEKSVIPMPSRIATVAHRPSGDSKTHTVKYIKPAVPYISSFEEEYPRAKELYTHARENVTNLLSDTRVGRSLDVAEAKYTVSSLVDSVLRHPDALMLLSSLREKSDHAVTHAVNVCTLAITFGRYIGFNKKQLTEIGLGALLHDIGETKLPGELLAKNQDINNDELLLLQSHTTIGATILHKSKGLPESVIRIARDHHERANGSGYPQKLIGSEIDLYTTMVSIVDTYDTVTSGLYDKPKITCADAMKNLYVWRNQLFDSLLVEKFIQCLGIYPIGSTVELRSGAVGIVISINHETRLYPKLLMVRDREKAPLEQPRVINLALFQQKPNHHEFEIKRVVNPEDYNIDTRNYLLREIKLH